MSALTTLTHWLLGEFDNQVQATDQPVWFVHLRLWHQPLPFRINDHVAIFCEQANALYLDAPYRQRVMILRPVESPDREDGSNPAELPIGQVEYRAFKFPDRVQGAGANPQLLESLTPDDLELLPGCELTIRQTADRFKADPDPNQRCCFQYNGQMRQVILGFEASEAEFCSFDRGIDPDTGRLLWGALMGAYQFQKRQNFALPQRFVRF
ncbi:MAG: chromophore lyase CpcT/CpeT [Elainella sp. Prado103]|jgi:hypothetical protein|nr:chromophore lyase CpcT/CpeT [Elainella sp. Prado103]